MRTEPKTIYRMIFIIAMMGICIFMCIFFGHMHGTGWHESFFDGRHGSFGRWTWFIIPLIIFFFCMFFRGGFRTGDRFNWREGSSSTDKNDNSKSGNENAVAILKMRLAKGEINSEEYNKLLETILKS